MMSSDTQAQISVRCAVVVIGRNEGARLVGALTKLQAIGCPVIYVDSASQDGSVTEARAMGIDVIELKESQGLSAAKARNTGARWIAEHHPKVEFIQFIGVSAESELGAGAGLEES